MHRAARTQSYARQSIFINKSKWRELKQTHVAGRPCPRIAITENMPRTDTASHTHTHQHAKAHSPKHTLVFPARPAEVSLTAARAMMDVLYLLSSRQLLRCVDGGSDEAIGQRTLYPPPHLSSKFVCLRVRVCALPLGCLSRLLPRFQRQEKKTPGHILPSHLPRRCLGLPLTGGVAAVMDDRALAVCVRVLHLCYLPCGSLSKTSCRVSSAPSAPSCFFSLHTPPAFPRLYLAAPSAFLYLAHRWGLLPKSEPSGKFPRIGSRPPPPPPARPPFEEQLNKGAD